LNNGRTGLGGGAVGGMKALIRASVQQAKDRKQFGKSIAEFGLVRDKITQMMIDCFASESAVFMVAHYIDSGYEDYSVEAAMSKVFASEAIQRSCYEALQIAAGNGFMKEFPYERATRDSRILSIFEGTNEILRLYVALSGMKDVGGSLKELRGAINDIFNNPIKGFGVLSGYTQRRFTQATGFGTDRIIRELTPKLRKSAEVYEKYTLELARVVDELLRKHGKDIADYQYQQRRVADIAIDLFVGLCTLSRADSLAKANDPNAAQAINIAALFTKQAKRRMAANTRAIDRNEDEDRDALAAFALDKGTYPWDVI
jgi:alkylation response protein AidB-like acyl-CoA dehydrogenase